MYNDENERFIGEIVDYLKQKNLYSPKVYDEILDMLDGDPIEENEYTHNQVRIAADAAVWRVLHPDAIGTVPPNMSHNLFVTLSTVAPPLRWRVHHISTTNGLPVLTECQHESSRGISANDIWNGFNCGLADEIVTSIRKKSSIWNKMSKKERKRFETDTKYANKLYAEHWTLEDIIQADINYDGIFVHADDDCQAYVFTKWTEVLTVDS